MYILPTILLTRSIINYGENKIVNLFTSQLNIIVEQLVQVNSFRYIIWSKRNLTDLPTLPQNKVKAFHNPSHSEKEGHIINQLEGIRVKPGGHLYKPISISKSLGREN